MSSLTRPTFSPTLSRLPSRNPRLYKDCRGGMGRGVVIPAHISTIEDALPFVRSRYPKPDRFDEGYATSILRRMGIPNAQDS